jgi:hypothetical protein
MPAWIGKIAGGIPPLRLELAMRAVIPWEVIIPAWLGDAPDIL